MITIKKPEEIRILKEGGEKLARIIHKVAGEVKPGVSTAELDIIAEKLIKESGGVPSFKNYKSSGDRKPFPASVCVSINDEVVHGIPNKNKVLKEGDIVGLDAGMKHKGLYTDMAITVPVGRVSKEAQKIMDVAKESLARAVRSVRDGAHIGDIGHAIQAYVESEGFNAVRNLVGHGVGHKVHEEPEIPNFGRPGIGLRLEEGMVLAIEPMIVEGSPDLSLDDDNWTWRTMDGSLSAHFEHTVAVTKTGAEILTKL